MLWNHADFDQLETNDQGPGSFLPWVSIMSRCFLCPLAWHFALRGVGAVPLFAVRHPVHTEKVKRSPETPLQAVASYLDAATSAQQIIALL